MPTSSNSFEYYILKQIREPTPELDTFSWNSLPLILGDQLVWRDFLHVSCWFPSFLKWDTFIKLLFKLLFKLLSKAHRTRKFSASVSAKTTWIKSTKLWSVSSEDAGTMKLFNFPSHQIWQFCICGSAVRIIFARTLSFDKLNSDAKKLRWWGTSTLGWRVECWALETSSGWWGERRVKRFVFCAGRIAARLLPSSQLHTYRWHIVHKTNGNDR